MSEDRGYHLLKVDLQRYSTVEGKAKHLLNKKCYYTFSETSSGESFTNGQRQVNDFLMKKKFGLHSKIY
jgi:hypothetical protein